MKCIFSFCAEGIIRDIQTNAISVFNIFEEVNAQGFPVFIPKIFFFCLLERKNDEPEKSDFKVKVINNKQILAEVNLPADFQNKLRNRLIVEFGGLALNEPGELLFNLYSGKKVVGACTLEVKKIGETKVKMIK